MSVSPVFYDLSEMGIDIIIVLGVVFMVGGGYEEGIEINDVHPQVLQIVQSVHDSLQVSSVEFLHIVGGRVLIPVLYLFRIAAVIEIFPVLHVRAGIPFAEAVRKDLIAHGPGGPLRHRKIRHQVKALLPSRPDPACDPPPSKAQGLPLPGPDPEIVVKGAPAGGKAAFKVVKDRVGPDLFHGPGPPCRHDKAGLRFVFQDAETKEDPVPFPSHIFR